MSRVALALAATLLLAGCSSLPTTGDGIVAIEVTAPASATLPQGESVTLSARAVNQQGDSVAAEIRWFTPDTLAVQVDSLTGTVTALLPSGSARVQAAVGTLHSAAISFILAAPTPSTRIVPSAP